MSEEKKLILEMFKEGKITIDEAEKLLDAQSSKTEQNESPVSKSPNRKFLKVFVREDNNTKVNINIPIALAEVGLKLIPKDKLKLEGIDIDSDEILKLIHDGSMGELVNVETMDEGKEVKVKICIE